MRELNLVSINQAFNSLDRNLQSDYFLLFGIDYSQDELNDLASFVESLRNSRNTPVITNKYFMNYSIPQIGKEFDLLRFGKEYIVNIELKRTSTDDKIRKQLKRNQYYLSFLDKKIYSYTYISSTKSLFTLTENGSLIQAKFSELVNVLYGQNCLEISDIDSLFNPSNYLVSPFNSTGSFLEGSYFLTVQQEGIKTKVMNSVYLGKGDFYSISGKAGTGKTLLIYDIARELINDRKQVLLIHCGKLNDGHHKLNKNTRWDIIPAKQITQRRLGDYDLVVVDETQRIYPNQLNDIIKEVRLANNCCVFAYDSNQTLRSWEKSNNIEALIEKAVTPIKSNLTEKIRTNKEVANFIKGLFNKAKNVEKVRRSNIEISYFSDYTDARKYMIYQKDNWKIVNYTPSNRTTHPYELYSVNLEQNAHEVIGQEFDQVLAVIDPYFCYVNNKLAIKDYTVKPYYDPVMMLFQAVTRTRKKLNVVIINNPEIMARCLSLVE